MSADLLALLDQLDEARGKATPGPWAQHPADLLYVIGDVSDGGESYLDVADTVAGAYPDAALIVAAVNALPQLLAAVRAGLALADEYEANGRAREATGMPAWPLNVAREFRDAITAALTPEQVQP